MSAPSGEPAADPGAAVGRLKRHLKPLLNLVALVFVVLAARDLFTRWEGSHVELAPALAVLACVPLLASCVVQGFAWIALVEHMASQRVPRGPALALYLKSQLARYTPGKVGLPLVRMEGAPRLSLAPKLVGISVLIEMLSWTATGAVVGFGLLAVTAPENGLGGLFGRFSLPLLGLSLVVAGLLLFVDRARYPQKLRNALAPGGAGPLVPLAVPLIQLVYWALVALHGYLMSLALGADPSAALPAPGFYVIASVAGFVVLAAPAGLGVREAVLLTGLSPSMGAAGALGAAVISRAASLGMELLAWLAVRALWGVPRPTPQADPEQR
jgi:uncharacterized membrane protein YbhN (UPF0104 family)